MQMMQKFRKGDLVRVAKDLGPHMSHFTGDCEAIVMGSYADQFGGDDHKSYKLYLNGVGESSWYDEWQLTLIESGRLDKLQTWKDEADAESKQKGNLDWIFSNGQSVIDKPHNSSIQALAECFGLTNLWGSRGEGIDYYANSMSTLLLAEPYLKAGDKSGWMEFCELIRKTQKKY